MDTYYSHGKLLLTGEYSVLDGALALAIPTRMGQTLYCYSIPEERIHWKSFDLHGKLWYESIFKKRNGILTSEDNSKTSQTLLTILQAAKELNPQFLDTEQGWEVLSNLEFPQNWGLGSSSTLINNIASWAKVDAFRLLKNSFGGSGYDIAAAQHTKPILYQWQKDSPQISEINLHWPFRDQLFFVHLNKKQDSKEGIARYKARRNDISPVEPISQLTTQIAQATSLDEFETLLDAHEQYISKLIDLPTLKSVHFANYPGSIKSLGAWGGDFMLVTGTPDSLDYFKALGYTTIRSFNEMIL